MNIELNSAFKQANKSKKRYRVLMGGAGSGKSHFMAQETLINMLSDDNYKYLVVRKTGKTIRASVFELLAGLISLYDLNRYFKINKSEMSITCINGSKLITSGLDDVEKLKSIANINRIWIEEASEISEQDMNQLDLRMRGQNKLGYQMTLTFNPISELHWLKKVFFDVGKDDAYILKTTYKDNPYLDDEYIKALSRLEQEDYQYYQIYALGEWGSLGNLIFMNWEKQDLKRKVELDGKEVRFCDIFDNYYNGGDWGFADDPFAAVRVHYDKTRKTIYIVDEIYQTGLLNEKSAIEVTKMIGNEYITMDSAEPKSIAEYKSLGIKAKGAKKGKGSVEHGIKWLQGKKIIVDESCTNMIKELTSYKWKEDKDGNIQPKPVDANNHLIDALRYALESEMKQTGFQFLK